MQLAGSDAGRGAVCEDDHLVDPCRERRDLGDGRPEDGVVRVDPLSDEDQPHAQKKSVSPSDSVHASARASSGSVNPMPM